ncbi:MAG: Gmad2 immunoglobulin-like domain-containing protein [Candidatus Thermoplasmatota archaeon]|nr:Gmad2 immunoglobulin-like domain-containing protein [Candidatus Thermoplasmatota archaeon]
MGIAAVFPLLVAAGCNSGTSQNQNTQTPTTTQTTTTTSENNQTPTSTPPVSDKSDLIKVTAPVSGSTISSPLHVEGQARGSWYFEASFPVKLLDANGKVLGQIPAKAQGEWMTKNFVPFKADLIFTVPATETGTLVLEKDNPSGLPQNSDELRIPVKFNIKTRTVKLYYYNQAKDQDATGNVMCTSKGLVAVDRQIPSTITPIKDTINLLLQGNLTSTEKAQGISTEYPLPGLTLKSAALSNGTLTLEFSDPQNKTSGGSCRAGILWYQIEATAKQFSGVTTVKFKPETLFQP